MTMETCPDLEVLFAELAEGKGPALEHARSCLACSALLEEHRQLEKDLYRLADPLPPPDFVTRVMARVAESPAPGSSPDLKIGLGILLASMVVAAALLIAQGGGPASLGAGLAEALVRLRPPLSALAGALAALWKTAALPFAVSLALLLTLSLLGLKRLAGHPSSDFKVTP